MAAGGQTHGSVLLNLKQAMAPEHEAQPEAEAAADRAHKAHVPYEQVMEYAGHSQSVSSVEFSKGMDGGRLIASGSADRTVKLWHTSSGTLLQDWHGHAQGVSDVSFSDDSLFLASASDDGTVRLWETESTECLAVLRGHAEQVMCVVISPRGNMIASAGVDDQILLWDTRSGRKIRAIPAHSGPITSLAFERGGDVLASSSYDGLIRLWDATSGACLKTVVGEHSPSVGGIYFAEGGEWIASATLDSAVTLWDVEGRSATARLTGHENVRYLCRPTALGERAGKAGGGVVVCGSESGPSAAVWDLESGRLVQTVRGFAGVPTTMDCHRERDAFVTGELGASPRLRLFARGDVSWMAEEARRDLEELGIGSEGGAEAEAASSSSSSSAAAAGV